MTTGTTLNLSLKDANGNKIANDKIQWETSKSTVATVSAKGAVKGVKAGTATITAVYQGKPYTCKVTVKNATLSKTSFSLVKGCTQKLTMKSASGSTIASKNITWKTSSKSIATVDKNGTVKGIKAGTATITGTYKGKAYTCKVTVKNMSLNKTSATLYMGDKLTLKVSGNSNKTTWSTSSKKIATVNSKGVVTPVKPGTVTITAKKNGETFKCKVTVKWPPEKGKTSTKSYTFNKAGSYNNYESELYTYELAGKGTIKVTAQIKEVGTANWSDYLRMSIEDDSFINIKEQTISYADGKVSISASVNPGKYYVSIGTYCKADVSISVTTKPTIIAPAKNLGRGYTHKFKVTGVKNKGTWSTSDKKIATVTSDGVVKGVKNGSCKIYYTMKDGKKLSYSVNIVNPVTLKVKYISDTTIYNECGVEICNNTGKKIEYTDFNITQYNYRGSKLRSPYDYYYCSVSVDPYSTRTREYWVHDNTGSVKLKLNFARFTDGKKYKP